MDRLAALDRIIELLDAPEGPTVNTSMRLPDTLREAVALAVGALDLAPSTTTFTADAMRTELNRVVLRAGLDALYEEYPDARPTLAQVTLARAQQDGHPSADEPHTIERAVGALGAARPGVELDPDDVLLWIDAQRAVGA
jgi:hypothetical protein